MWGICAHYSPHEIVGPLPSTCQIDQNTNKFWHLVGDTIGLPLVDLDYNARLQVLLDHHIGLWDVVAEARRIGSLDSRIRDHASNDLLALVDTLPNLTTIAFNGGTAAKIGIGALGAREGQHRLLRLPSSSPAYASVPYADKLAAWPQLQLANR
jgi:hypoxanthine-DNA glycosylase